MKKILSIPNGCFIYIMMTIIAGCSIGNSGNLGVPTTPTSGSILIPSNTPLASPLTSHPAISTPNDAATSKPNYLCEKVPEPILNNKVESSNVYLSGEFYLCTFDGTQIAFDFDSGKLGSAESAVTDIKLVISGASIDNRSLYFLRETNNSFVAVSELSLPTQEYCKQQTIASNRLTLVLASAGATGCILTNEGRLAFFQVEQLDLFGLESVEVSFTTWKK